jgi:hypothetical protein
MSNDNKDMVIEGSSKRKFVKPIIKHNKFLNMSAELWKETNEQSKDTRGICNLTYNDLFNKV